MQTSLLVIRSELPEEEDIRLFHEQHQQETFPFAAPGGGGEGIFPQHA